MRTFMMISAFDYRLTKEGRPYGWGIARYALPETIYPNLETALDSIKPETAAKILLEQLRAKFPGTEEGALRHIIG